MRSLSLKQPLGPGSSADPRDVMAVQSALNALGLYQPPSGSITDWVDGALIDGIARFQESRGFQRTGVIKPGDHTEIAVNDALVHVRAHRRHHGIEVIDVAEYDRSRPSHEGANQGNKNSRAWEGKPNEDFRQKIAESERSSNKQNNGYKEVNSKTNALGRYQVLKGTLIDAGWKSLTGQWIGKSQNYSIKNDNDFLDNPEAQEEFFGDMMKRIERQTLAKGSDEYIGKTLKFSDGTTVTITDSGVSAASHRMGAGATMNAISTLYDKTLINKSTLSESMRNVVTRLSNFQDITYTKGAW